MYSVGFVVRSLQRQKLFKLVLLFGISQKLDKCKLVFYDKKLLNNLPAVPIIERGKERFGELPFIVFKFTKENIESISRILGEYGLANGKLFGFSTPTEIYFTNTAEFGVNKLLSKQDINLLEKFLRKNKIKFKSKLFSKNPYVKHIEVID